MYRGARVIKHCCGLEERNDDRSVPAPLHFALEFTKLPSVSLNFEGCGWVRRWNPAACSTSLGSHVPTPRTFQVPGWEVEAAASSHPSGPGLGGAGLSWGSLFWGRRRRGQRPENPESLNGGASSGEGEGADVPAATSFPSLFPGLCSSAGTLPGEETKKVRERSPKATPGERSSWDGTR